MLDFEINEKLYAAGIDATDRKRVVGCNFLRALGRDMLVRLQNGKSITIPVSCVYKSNEDAKQAVA